MKVTQIRYSLKPGEFRPGVKFAQDNGVTLETLSAIGVSADAAALKELMAANHQGAALDAAPGMVTTPSTMTPVQFLQYWMPKAITAATTKRDIDDLVGRQTAGSFADAEVVQAVVELTGKARGYGDRVSGALADFNVNYEARTIIRQELDLEVGKLEEEQASRSRLNAAEIKREAVRTGLEIERNLIGFYGFNEGINRTYGLTNDPNLSAYETVTAAGAGDSTEWADKTFKQIVDDLLIAFAKLQAQSGNNVDPTKDKIKLFVSAAVVQFLNKPNEYGKTVRQWLQENYPGLEIKASAWLDDANGDQNVFYLAAEELNGNPVILQPTQDVLRLMGVFNKGKSYEEQYANATAGVFVVQPAGVVRYTGI